MINKKHKLSVRVNEDDEISSFADMQGKNLDVTSDQQNIEVLMTEFFKIMNNVIPSIMHNIVISRVNDFNLKNFQTERENCQMWPRNIKKSSSVTDFKLKVKLWRSTECRLCRAYL